MLCPSHPGSIYRSIWAVLQHFEKPVHAHSMHLALSISGELGQKSPFLTADLEARSAPLPVMASEGDHDKHPCGGSPCHNGRQPSSHRARTEASSSRASSSVMWIFTLCQRLPGLASCRDADLCLLIGVGLRLLQIWWSSSCRGSSLLVRGDWTVGKVPSPPVGGTSCPPRHW
jgi:hypothetical protein